MHTPTFTSHSARPGTSNYAQPIMQRDNYSKVVMTKPSFETVFIVVEHTH